MFILKSVPLKQSEIECMEFTESNIYISEKSLWHRRLGHTNEDNLDRLKNKELVTGLSFKNEKLCICDPCMLSKAVSLPYLSLTTRWSERPFQLMHMDLCGPMLTESFGQSKYLLAIVDDFSRRSFVYFLKSKDQTLEAVKDFITSQEVKTGKQLQAIRSDNGTEFKNRAFNSFVREKGITQQFTTVYSPESNGIAERMNRTLLDMARTMLLESCLPINFWAEAVATASHTRNVLPTKGQEETPMERWTGKKPTVKYFRVFGCVAYYVLPKVLRSKFKPRAERAIMVGYARERRGYRVYSSQQNKILEVRNVRFDESRRGYVLLSNPELTKTDVKELKYVHETEALSHDLSANGSQKDENVIPEPPYTSEESSEDESEPEPQKKSVGRPPGTTAEELRRNKRNRERELKELQAKQGLRRSERIKRQQQSDDQINLLIDLEERTPKTYQEAMQSPDAEMWRKAMDVEMESLQEHNVWNLKPKEKGERLLKSKWVYCIKTNAEGSVNKFKARLVVDGYGQRRGIDYEESFSPVVRMETLRTLLCIATKDNLVAKQFDIKTAYLHGDLKEQVSMTQPEGYEVQDTEILICKLQKSLYGLPQAGRCWYAKLNETLQLIGFVQCTGDPCVYVYSRGEDYAYLCVYVDDMIILGTSNKLIDYLISRIQEHFQLSDLGDLNFFLGLEITKTTDGLLIGQRKYTIKILEKFGMSECKPVSTPIEPGNNLEKQDGLPIPNVTKFQEIIGSLMHLTLGTRPDICFAITNLSRFMTNPQEVHLKAAKRILRYLQNTKDYVLKYSRADEDFRVKGYADASWGVTEDAKSFSGIVIQCGGNTIYWKTRKQTVVALSTCECEVIAIHDAVKEIVWIRSLIIELSKEHLVPRPVPVYTDNTSAISFFKVSGKRTRTRHINRKYYFSKEELEKGNIELLHIPSEDQTADLLTKGLPKEKLTKHMGSLKVVNKIVNRDYSPQKQGIVGGCAE